MASLEDLTPGTVVRGVVPDSSVTVVDVRWRGSAAIDLTPIDEREALGHVMLSRGDERSLVVSSVGQPIPDVGRFTGALLGGAIGDALGRPVEGLTPAQISARYGRITAYQDGPVGTVTDDTQLTMCVAACLATHGYLDADDLARRLIDWLPEGRGKGRATVAAVERLVRGVPWDLAGEESSGNGAAMRAAPVGLAFWDDPERLRADAVLSALPTHRAPMAVAGAVAMAAATAFLVARRPGEWTVLEFLSTVRAAIAGLEPGPVPERRDPSVCTTLSERLGELPKLLDRPPEEVFARLYNGAFVLESLPAAFYCFLRSPTDLDESLLVAVNAGYDADTVAAMAGTLGGALGGEAALPERLLASLEYRKELRALGRQLHSLAIYGDSTAALEVEGGLAGPCIANANLANTTIPAGDADWVEIWRFALTFDGYALWGTPGLCGTLANRWSEAYGRDAALPPTLAELRTCLFFEQRRWRHLDRDPHTAARPYIAALLEGIRLKVAAGSWF